MSAANKERILYSLEAEKALLAACMMESRVARWCLAKIDQDCFYREAHRLIYLAIQDVVEHGFAPDMLSVKNALVARGVLSDAGGSDYLIAVAQYVLNHTNFKSYANEVLESYARRGLRQRAQDLDRLIATDLPIQDLFARAFELTHGLYQAGTDTYKTSIFNPEKDARTDGLSSGLHKLDRHVGEGAGYPSEELTVIGARPGHGKTSWLVGSAVHACSLQRKPAYATLEMPAKKIALRMLQQISGWYSRPRVASYQRIWDEAVDMVRSWDMPVWDPSGKAKGERTIEALCAWAMDAHDAYGITELYVDYAQLFVSRQRFENRTRELDYVADEMTMLAKRLKIPIIVGSQLSMDQKGEPRTADSIKFENNAALIAYLSMPKESDQPSHASRWKARLIVKKSRHGTMGIEDIHWVKGRVRYEDPD